MIGHAYNRSVAYLQIFGSDFYTAGYQPIHFLAKMLNINNHSGSEYIDDIIP